LQTLGIFRKTLESSLNMAINEAIGMLMLDYSSK
jgi:hypothetical protein